MLTRDFQNQSKMENRVFYRNIDNIVLRIVYIYIYIYYTPIDQFRSCAGRFPVSICLFGVYKTNGSISRRTLPRMLIIVSRHDTLCPSTGRTGTISISFQNILLALNEQQLYGGKLDAVRPAYAWRTWARRAFLLSPQALSPYYRRWSSPDRSARIRLRLGVFKLFLIFQKLYRTLGFVREHAIGAYPVLRSRIRVVMYSARDGSFRVCSSTRVIAPLEILLLIFYFRGVSLDGFRVCSRGARTSISDTFAVNLRA